MTSFLNAIKGVAFDNYGDDPYGVEVSVGAEEEDYGGVCDPTKTADVSASQMQYASRATFQHHNHRRPHHHNHPDESQEEQGSLEEEGTSEAAYSQLAAPSAGPSEGYDPYSDPSSAGGANGDVQQEVAAYQDVKSLARDESDFEIKRMPFQFFASPAELAGATASSSSSSGAANDLGYYIDKETGRPTVNFLKYIDEKELGTVESAELEDVTTDWPFELGITMNGVQHNTQKVALSSKRCCNAIVWPSKNLLKSKSLAQCRISLMGQSFSEQYPKYNIQNLKDGIWKHEKTGLTDIENGHPVIEVLYKIYSSNNKTSQHLHKLASNTPILRDLPTRDVEIAMEDLHEAYKKEVPTGELKHLSLSFERSFVSNENYFSSSNKGSFAQHWTDPHMFTDKYDDSAKQEAAKKKRYKIQGILKTRILKV